MTKVKLIKVVKGGRKRLLGFFQRNREDYLVRTILFNLYCFMAKRITVKFGRWWCIVRFLKRINVSRLILFKVLVITILNS
jgi:hypothetical protein